MSAVLTEARDRDYRVRDPDCRGHRVMMAWAPYRRDAKRIMDAPHIERMPWSERLELAFDAEPPWVVQADRAVASLIKVNLFYERLIDRYYLDQQSIWQTAGNLERTPGFIAAYLNAVCFHVEQRVAYDPR